MKARGGKGWRGPQRSEMGALEGKRKRKRLGWMQVQSGPASQEGDTDLTIRKRMKESLWPAIVPVTGRAQDGIP